MFNNLIASGDTKKSVVNSRTLIVSGVAHVVLLSGAMYAAANAPKPGDREPEEQVTYVEIQPEPAPAPDPVEPPPPPEVEPEVAPEPERDVPAIEEPPAVVEAPPAPTPRPAPPVAKGYQELVPPASVPDRLPDVDASARAVKAEDFSGVGVAGGIAKGAEGGEARNTAKEPPSGKGDRESDGSGTPVDVNVVEERPSLQNASEMQRVLQRLYPPMLRDAGVTGQTMLKFVIDANGRVENGSVVVVSTSHDGFGSASVQAADKFRFRPAKIGGRAVRVSITMPISWTLDRG